MKVGDEAIERSYAIGRMDKKIRLVAPGSDESFRGQAGFQGARHGRADANNAPALRSSLIDEGGSAGADFE